MPHRPERSFSLIIFHGTHLVIVEETVVLDIQMNSREIDIAIEATARRKMPGPGIDLDSIIHLQPPNAKPAFTLRHHKHHDERRLHRRARSVTYVTDSASSKFHPMTPTRFLKVPSKLSRRSESRTLSVTIGFFERQLICSAELVVVLNELPKGKVARSIERGLANIGHTDSALQRNDRSGGHRSPKHMADDAVGKTALPSLGNKDVHALQKLWRHSIPRQLDTRILHQRRIAWTRSKSFRARRIRLLGDRTIRRTMVQSRGAMC